MELAPPSAARPPAAGLAALARRFTGELVVPGDRGYDRQRRVWNGSIDRYPALVARCAGPADVAAALTFAQETGRPVAVRGGGHSFPGLSVCDGGVVVDVGPMKGVQVDPPAREVRVQGGVLLGELDHATQRHGLAVPLGAVTHTGVAGLTLGGGIGWLMRRHGLTIDQLLSVDLVTAEGRTVTASRDEHPDLFWALRGGGGNFGVATGFRYRLNPVGPVVVSGMVLWSLDDGPEVLRFYRDWCADAPDELTTALVLRQAPAVDAVPADLHGRPVAAVVACWTGDLDSGERMLGELRRFGSPLLDLVARRPFTEQQSMFDAGFPHGLWVYMRARDVPALTDDVADILLDHSGRIASPASTVTVWQLGGAVARAAADETAFGSRSSGHAVNITGATWSADGFDRERRWVRDFSDALVPHQCGVYVNFLMDEGPRRVREAYGDRAYERLAAVKRRFDPGNAFRLNQNIRPTG